MAEKLWDVERCAARFRVRPNTVHEWVSLGMPVKKRGKKGAGNKTLIEPLKALEWYLDYVKSESEKTRLQAEQADRVAMENAARRGELGNVEEVANWYAGHVVRARARLIQIPDALRQFCDPRTSEQTVANARRLVHEALAELSAGLTARKTDHRARLEPAARVNGKRMG